MTYWRSEEAASEVRDRGTETMMEQSGDPAVRAAPSRFLPMLFTLGPGVVLIGGVVGSGELINTPVQAAKFGFVLLWAIILSCLIKYFLQVEVGRHCMVHDRTIFESLNLFPGPKLCSTSWIVLAFMLSWTTAQIGSAGIVGAIAGLAQGLAPLPLEDKPSLRIWAVVLFVVTQLLIWKSLYKHLERLLVALVIGFSASVVVALVLLQGTDHPVSTDQILEGLTFSLGSESPKAAAFAVISLMGGLGVAGAELMVYPYWIREKGYARHIGPRDAEGWRDRARGWIRMLKVDAALATILVTVITAAFFLLGCAVLFGQGDQPAGIGVVDRISEIFTQTYGPWSRSLFFLGAFCVLFSTLVAAAASNGRMYTDLLCSLGLVDRDRPASVRRSHQIVQTVFLVAVTGVFMWWMENPAALVVVSHFIIGLVMTPIAMVGICWLAFRTDREVRMSRLTAVLLVSSVLAIGTCVAVGVVVAIPADLISAVLDVFRLE